jgi:hypothetical protein
MAAATRTRAHESSNRLKQIFQVGEPQSLTLLELVETVSASMSDEREVVATILSLLREGRVKLRGNFRNEPIDSFEV